MKLLKLLYYIKTFRAEFFRFRSFGEALIVIEQMGMVYFTWTMVIVCMAMLLIQSETVEYFNSNHYIIFAFHIEPDLTYLYFKIYCNSIKI